MRRFPLVIALVASMPAVGGVPPIESDVVYQVTIDITWSEASHPEDWPGIPHMSPPVGSAHDDQVTFWRDGELASPGVQNVAELGGTGTLSGEIQVAVLAGHSLPAFTYSGIPAPGVTGGTFTMRRP